MFGGLFCDPKIHKILFKIILYLLVYSNFPLAFLFMQITFFQVTVTLVSCLFRFLILVSHRFLTVVFFSS